MQSFVAILIGLFAMAVPTTSASLSSQLKRSLTTCNYKNFTFALQTDCGFVSIHGLWPEGSDCNYCTSVAFNESSLSATTLAGMNKYWKSCAGGNSNLQFWEHEWSRHGTCSGLDQNTYFTTALQMFNQFGSKCSSACDLCIERSTLTLC